MCFLKTDIISGIMLRLSLLNLSKCPTRPQVIIIQKLLTRSNTQGPSPGSPQSSAQGPNTAISAGNNGGNKIEDLASSVHFDTLQFIQRLESNGLTTQQAEGVLKALSEVINDRYSHPLVVSLV